MNDWREIRLNTLRQELFNLEEVISKINNDGIYSDGGFQTKLSILYRQIEVLKDSLDLHECTCWKVRDILKVLTDGLKFVLKQHWIPFVFIALGMIIWNVLSYPSTRTCLPSWHNSVAELALSLLCSVVPAKPPIE